MPRWLIGGLFWLASATAWAGMADLIAASKPSVVAVGSYNALNNPRFAPRGTGFVVGDGSQVVTNAHVLPADADKGFGNQIRVRVVAGSAAPSERIATVLKVDAAHDLALLRIDGARLPALSLAASDPDAHDPCALVSGLATRALSQESIWRSHLRQ